MRRISFLSVYAALALSAALVFTGCAQKKSEEPKQTTSQPEATTPSSGPAETAPDTTTPPDTMSTGDDTMGGAR